MLGMNKMDKKGIDFTLKNIMSLVIAAVVAFIFLYAGSNAYGAYTANNDEKRVQNQMNKISELAETIFREGGEGKVEIHPPGEGWIVRTFADLYNDFPSGQCRGAIGCVCMCDGVDCDNLVRCEAFPFDIEVVGDYNQRVSGLSGEVGGGDLDNKVGTALRLGSIQRLILFKDGDLVKIRRGE